MATNPTIFESATGERLARCPFPYCGVVGTVAQDGAMWCDEHAARRSGDVATTAREIARSHAEALMADPTLAKRLDEQFADLSQAMEFSQERRGVVRKALNLRRGARKFPSGSDVYHLRKQMESHAITHAEIDALESEIAANGGQDGSFYLVKP